MTENQKPEHLSKRRALKIIRKAAENSANVFISQHAEEKMEVRAITRTQILRVLRTGTLYDGPTDNLLYDNWECGVKGFSAGEYIRLRVGIERDEQGIIVITLFGVG